MAKGTADKRREALATKHWPKEIPWRGAGGDDKETGWFSAPRTLPVLLQMMREKKISKGKGDLSRVYVELLSRQRGQGVVEMESPEVHAYACGYSRRKRTWEDLMATLERAGFIRTKSGNGRRYDIVFIVHPAVVVKRLADGDLIPEALLNTYYSLQVKGGERNYDQVVAAAESQWAVSGVVLPMKGIRAKK